MPDTAEARAPDAGPSVTRYLELDGDVFEAIQTQFGTYLINRTRPLRTQIEYFYRRAQEGQ